VVRIYRDAPRHEIHDVKGSTCLRGDFSAAYLEGDQSAVLPTDSQKQTAYAYAKEKGLASIEDYGLALARHFVHDLSPFGLENNNEVFNADDRPYGLIQASITRDDAPAPGSAWINSRVGSPESLNSPYLDC
jgi:urate oxidase